jgi:hypothetical protein
MDNITLDSLFKMAKPLKKRIIPRKRIKCYKLEDETIKSLEYIAKYNGMNYNQVIKCLIDNFLQK